MNGSSGPTVGCDRDRAFALPRVGVLALLPWAVAVTAADWPQYRGPTTDGRTPESISPNWPASGPTVRWTNPSLTNGFSSFAVSQGRAFVMSSQDDGSGNLFEYCVAVDAVTGTNIWQTLIDIAPWDPSVTYNGGDGAPPYNTGDGPRTTPSVTGGSVLALSGLLHLVCMNATNGSVLWSNNLPAVYGASGITWENGASPCVDDDLVYVNLHTSNTGGTLAAFRVADGGMAWSTQNEQVTHTTPSVAVIQGVRQVIFATRTGLVSLDRTSGAFLWKFIYPFAPIDTSMGASPIVYSNMVYCTAGYGRGAAVVQVTYTNSAWTTNQLWFQNTFDYRSIWMSPVCYQGYVYTLCGENSTFLTTPLCCIELATGILMWATNNFGMGGLILANDQLLVLTEDGQLVLAGASPDGYSELARYQAFHFSADAPGKCWISPALSDGGIYAHSTRGGICLSVSEPLSPLQLLPPQLLNAGQVRLTVATRDGTPISSNRLDGIRVRAANSLRSPLSTWPALTNPLVLSPNGQALMTNPIAPGQTRQFFSPAEQP
jgi:hypothetical protein